MNISQSLAERSCQNIDPIRNCFGRGEILLVQEGFLTLEILTFGLENTLLWGIGLFSVRCLQHSWPLPTRCSSTQPPAPSTFLTIKNVSRHCHMFPGEQNLLPFLVEKNCTNSSQLSGKSYLSILHP